MLNVRRRRPGAEQVCLPVGDGSSKLGEPMHTDWIVATSQIMQILEDSKRNTIDVDLMRHFASVAVFERRVSKDNEDVSKPLAREFKRVLRHLFQNQSIDVQPALHKTKTGCTWASLFFVSGQRSIGLHFLTVDPFFEVFREPSGEAPSLKEEDKKEHPANTTPLPTPEKRPIRGGPTSIPTQSWKESIPALPAPTSMDWTPPSALPTYPIAVPNPFLPSSIGAPNPFLPSSLQQTLNVFRNASAQTPPPRTW